MGTLLKPSGIWRSFDSALITHVMCYRCLGASAKSLPDAFQGVQTDILEAVGENQNVFIIYGQISLCAVTDPSSVMLMLNCDAT